ncbi:hypothetical protein KVR01_005684 [Diaporthe batatas]|uniref:uncharacterized protein n=1 Tax=Diaporthe batatas TaxID=748121 RepID=UPI001D0360B2|nr:uncharacterized protein KVR01_005684 [Diaporthe batatas]KAG8165409.1 hypothetical protein KVR01_005684 [Diaporthe batatas]
MFGARRWSVLATQLLSHPTGSGIVFPDAHKMDPIYKDIAYIEEEQSGTWVVVQETLHCDKTRQQIEACDALSTKKLAIIINNEARSDLALESAQANSHLPTVGFGLHNVELLDGNPTSDPRVVESADSTATGRTFSTPKDVSSDRQSGTPAEDDSPSQPLTQANLFPSNTPALVKDIQAWVNGDLGWLRLPVICDQAGGMPFARATTRYSSGGSLDFVFIPAQPSSFGRDALTMGAQFEQTPFTKSYGSDMELDED